MSAPDVMEALVDLKPEVLPVLASDEEIVFDVVDSDWYEWVPYGHVGIRVTYYKGRSQWRKFAARRAQEAVPMLQRRFGMQDVAYEYAVGLREVVDRLIRQVRPLPRIPEIEYVCQEHDDCKEHIGLARACAWERVKR